MATDATLPVEVYTTLFSFADRAVLARCARVSRLWNTISTPILWRTISITQHTTLKKFEEPCVRAALVKNARFVRVFETAYLGIVDWLFMPQPLPSSSTGDSLVTLQDDSALACIFSNLTALRINDIFCRNSPPFLSSECSIWQGTNEELQSLFICLIMNNPDLQHVSLRTVLSKYEDLLKAFSAISLPKLETLKLFPEGSPHDNHPLAPKLQLQTARCFLETLSKTIRHVNVFLDIDPFHMESIQGQKNRTCIHHPALESFEIYGNLADMGEQLLVEFFKTCGPNLNHINIPGMKHILLPNLFRALKEANAIVTSTLDLRFEQIQEDNDISSIIGLSTTWSEIYLSDQGYASALTARAIAANGQDLQELDIIGCPRIDSANLQQILCHTFQLKRLHAGCTIAPHMLGNPFLCASDVAASSWVCLDLQEFVVNIEGVPRPDLKTGHDTPRLRRLLDEGTIEESHAIQRRVLRQLGALKSLKRLCLGHPLVQYKRHIYQAQSEFLRLQDFYYQVSCLEMSLDSGLDQLVELKDLEELHVTGMAHRIGVDELEWMLLHWPKLKRLAGLFHSQHKILEPNVAVWLQERRPVWAEEYLVKDYFTDESRTLRRQKF